VSRLPIYDEDIDNIIAVVYAKDLFLNPKELNDIVEEILYVPETKSAFELLKEFRQKQMSIAVVLDEYGGTAGLVTTEDLIEELFGEIYDEFDIDHEPMYVFEDDKTIRIIARAEVDELNQKFNLNIPEGDYTTLGGFIIEQLGRIPRVNETIELERCKIIVEKASRKRVILVKVICEQDFLNR
jgi:CBS domain containing-hemolysin-like protein